MIGRQNIHSPLCGGDDKFRIAFLQNRHLEKKIIHSQAALRRRT
jgi:hypothetical protein